jgi:hypothetical protein
MEPRRDSKADQPSRVKIDIDQRFEGRALSLPTWQPMLPYNSSFGGHPPSLQLRRDQQPGATTTEQSKLTRSLPSDNIAPSTFTLCVDLWGFCCWPYSRRA